MLKHIVLSDGNNTVLDISQSDGPNDLRISMYDYTDQGISFAIDIDMDEVIDALRFFDIHGYIIRTMNDAHNDEIGANE